MLITERDAPFKETIMPSKGSQKPSNEMRSRYRKIKMGGKTLNLHRYLMEQHLGRKLLPNEIVHHINGDRFDNRIENLTVMSVSEHSRMENLGKKLSDEHKAKVSNSLIGNHRRKGILHTPEIKSQISESVKKARASKFWSTKKK